MWEPPPKFSGFLGNIDSQEHSSNPTLLIFYELMGCIKAKHRLVSYTNISVIGTRFQHYTYIDYSFAVKKNRDHLLLSAIGCGSVYITAVSSAASVVAPERVISNLIPRNYSWYSMASLEKKKRKRTKIGCIFLYIIAARSSEVLEMFWVLFEYWYHIILIKNINWYITIIAATTPMINYPQQKQKLDYE